MHNEVRILIESQYEALIEDDAQEENAQNDHLIETQLLYITLFTSSSNRFDQDNYYMCYMTTLY